MVDDRAEGTFASPSGCLIAKMRAARSRLGSVTGEHLDRICAEASAAYAMWLRRAADRGEVELPEAVDTMAAYVDAQFTMVLNRIAAGDDPDTVRTHARLAFAVLSRAGTSN